MPRLAFLVILAALLAATGAAAQTPRTPGPAGAIAAVEAFVAAQSAQDWPAALLLLAPESVASLRSTIPQIVVDAQTILADSGRAAVPDDADVLAGYDRFVTARRALAVVQGARTPDEELVALMTLDASLEPGFTFDAYRTAQPVGVQLEGDLAHVVVRTSEDDWENWSTIGTATLRWADGHWGFLTTRESFWFMNRPDVSGLEYNLARGALRPLPDEDIPPSAPSQTGRAPTPDATPETPGPAGAEAAARALVAAQGAQDWPAIFSLVNPEALEEAAASVRAFARRLHDALADSAVVVASDEFREAGDPAVFRAARRLDAVLPPGDSLSDVDVMARVLEASGARNPSRLDRFREPPVLVVLGVVVENAELAHVVGRAAGEPVTDTELVAMRWTGSRWAVAHRHIEGPALDPLDKLLGSDWTEGVFDIIRDEGDLASPAE